MNVHERKSRCGGLSGLPALALIAAIGLAFVGGISPVAADDDDD